MQVFPIILAGGQGSRFWPLSRERHPKQFLSISPSGETLIQATARRVEAAFPNSTLLVVTNEHHKDLVLRDLPDSKIITEPITKNTAAAIGLAAINIKRQDPNGIMLILPADHNIKNLTSLISSWKVACDLAFNENKLVTLGIKPEYPHTGYGYIKRGLPISGYSGSFELDRFYEKPNLDRATEYCNSGAFSWNAGMFVWKAGVILQEIKTYMPKLYEALLKIEEELNTTTDEYQILGRISKEFGTLDSISIDFGVMEHSTQCVIVAAEDIGWSDVGSWDVWAEHLSKDENNNAVQGSGLLRDTENCMIYSNKFFATIGVSNLIIIDTPDGLLVCDKNRAQEVKNVVEYLKKIKRGDLV